MKLWCFFNYLLIDQLHSLRDCEGNSDMIVIAILIHDAVCIL